MAIGDSNYSNNNTGNSAKPFENEYYTRLRFRSEDDCLSISYKSGLMKIKLGVVEGGKTTDVAVIHLSMMKANMLAHEIDKFIEYRKGSDIDPNKAFGVNAGMGETVTFIGFSTNDDKDIFMTIGKFDGKGVITESAKFKFAVDYNYALEWNDINSNDLEKVYYNDQELITLRNAIADFGRSMTGASAYGYADLTLWDNFRNNKRIDQIFDKLGIERRSSGSYNRSQGSNDFLSNTSSKSVSMDDIEDMLI